MAREDTTVPAEILNDMKDQKNADVSGLTGEKAALLLRGKAQSDRPTLLNRVIKLFRRKGKNDAALTNNSEQLVQESPDVVAGRDRVGNRRVVQEPTHFERVVSAKSR